MALEPVPSAHRATRPTIRLDPLRVKRPIRSAPLWVDARQGREGHAGIRLVRVLVDPRTRIVGRRGALGYCCIGEPVDRPGVARPSAL